MLSEEERQAIINQVLDEFRISDNNREETKRYLESKLDEYIAANATGIPASRGFRPYIAKAMKDQGLDRK